MWDDVSEGCHHSPDVVVGASHCHDRARSSWHCSILTCCSSVLQEENVGSAISFALGVNRARHIQLVSIWDDDVDNDHPSSPTSSLAAEAAKAQAKVRACILAGVSSRLHPSRCRPPGDSSRDVDVHVLTAGQAAGGSGIKPVHEGHRWESAGFLMCLLYNTTIGGLGSADRPVLRLCRCRPKHSSQCQEARTRPSSEAVQSPGHALCPLRLCGRNRGHTAGLGQ